MAEFRMPSLGADMEAGTLVEWRVAPGQAIKRGDIVAVVETQKGAIEIEIFEDGVIDKLLVQPGDHVPVGTALALVGGEGEEPPGAPAEGAAQALAAVEGAPRAAAVAPPALAPAEATPRPRVSPAARRRAEALGLDLSDVAGTGPRGAITLEDVEAAAGGAPPEAPQPMRAAIAAAMARSKREIPHYYLGHTIPLEQALTWLAEANQKRAVPERLLPGVLLLKAVALALRKVPELNGVFEDGAFRSSPAIHLGVAVSLRQGGLVAPALFDADRKDLDTLMREFRDLVQRTRAGGLRSSELSAPTITVTSLGDQGVDEVFPVIYPPQVAIVGFGTIAERPWAVDGALKAGRVVRASLAADHRVSDGHRGGLFLRAVEQLLQEPEKL